MASNKREQLILTAQALFSREGYHATGIDRIIAESGVAKMTLYKHFKSKDELILAVLDMLQQSALQQMAEIRRVLPPREALLGTFNGLHGLIHQDGFCGCSVANAAAEFQDRAHPIHRQAALFKEASIGHFRELAEALGILQADALALQLQFLLDGAMSMAHAQGPGEQALIARAAAEALISSAQAVRA